MKNQLSLDIKTPCSENFNEFKPTAKGGFCASCDKDVIDFTTMNSEEIISYFKNKSNKNTCGKFNNNQLKTYYSKPKQAKKLSFFGGIGLAFLTLFSFGKMQAQDTKNNTKESDDDTKKIDILKEDKMILVKGHVSSSDDGLPLPGVNVVLEGSDKGVQTDFDGDFTFPEKLKVGDVLIFSFIGMDSRKVIITNQDSASKIELKVDIGLQFTECIVVGKVAVKKVYASKKNK